MIHRGFHHEFDPSCYDPPDSLEVDVMSQDGWNWDGGEGDCHKMGKWVEPISWFAGNQKKAETSSRKVLSCYVTDFRFNTLMGEELVFRARAAQEPMLSLSSAFWATNRSGDSPNLAHRRFGEDVQSVADLLFSH